MNSCFGIEDDENWAWLLSFEDESGNDIFKTYDNYDESRLMYSLQTDLAGSFSDTFATKISENNVDNVIFYQQLVTGAIPELSQNNDRTWYYFDYGNGDVDTVYLEVKKDGDYPCWCAEGFKDMSEANFYFNGELAYTFDFKNNPGLDHKIMDGEANTLIFTKRSVIAE